MAASAPAPPDFDATFEFDAPRYYDFECASAGTPADHWFDTAPDGPGVKPERTDAKSRQPFKELQDTAQQPKQPAEKPPEKKRGNIVTSWGAGTSAAAGSAAAAAAAGAGASQRRPGPGGSPPSKPAGQQQAPGAAAATAAGATAGKEARRVATVSGHRDGARSEPPVTRSMSRLGAALCSPVPEDRPKLASPPATRSRALPQRRFYTVQKGKATSARTAKAPATAGKLHQVLLPKVTKPLRSTKPLTLPDDFELQTSKRGEGRAAAAGPQQEGKSPFKPLAEKVRDFQYKTPTRFKSKPAAKAATSKKRSPITKAQPPQLLTSVRSRPSRFKSQQELEAEQAEQAQHDQFKAKPLDMRVLTSSGQLGVPRVEKPRPTEPQPFVLRSDSRAKLRRSHGHASLEAAAAPKPKVQPLNRSILDGPTFVPTKDKPRATVPLSPELLTKKRAQSGPSAQAHPSDEHMGRAADSRPRTRSHAGSSGILAAAAKAGPPKLTQPQAFNLHTEVRGAQHQEELAARLAAEEARAKRLRRVTARPLPVTVDVPVVPPKPEPKALTLPDPFELKSLARHADYEEQRQRQLQEEQQAAQRAAEFKARPLSASGPFIVHESEAPLTVPVDPHLATEARAVERHEFDEHVAERMAQEEEERRQRQELKRQAEEEAVREYRKKLRFSARPMPSFSQRYFAQPSAKPLTNPKTPNFASKKLQKRTGGPL